jgi:isocitrate dehydrogenase kinase/phosphatase
MVFGFTRTYFQVDLDAPRRVVAFLRSLLPGKRIDELYTVLGYHKHGKREFYQALVRTLRQPGARFERAEGVRGMVMVVFALPPMNVVFKVIKDRADPPKTVTRREVIEKYRFVFGQEYGGRLADTQEFEDLSLPREAFPAEVREELLTQAAESVRESGDWLVFDHLYTERRMTPLDLYLRQAPPDHAERAVIDFGRAIKELAGINVFPGDMLAKNFGVTRHGRVVFYDYDEIGALDACTFRQIPTSTTVEEEMAAEPWFSVREGDVFPEEFERFVRLPGRLHEVFLAHHGDLFTPEYWNAARRRVVTEGISEPAPYPRERRLRRDGDGVAA